MIGYKYTRAANLSSVLERGRFAFPDIPALNDPFESSIETTIALIRSELQHDYVGPPASSRIRRTAGYSPYSPQYEAYLETKSKNERIRAENELNQRAEEALKLFQEHVGVLALADDPLNIVLWAHYAANGSGFCVAVDFDHPSFTSYLPRSLSFAEFSSLFRIGKVRYELDRPRCLCESASEYVSKAFFTKYERWAYEGELRLLRPLAECETTGRVPLFGFPLDAIREVYLGPRSNPELSDKSIELLRLLPHIALYRVDSISRSYTLQKWLISGPNEESAAT